MCLYPHGEEAQSVGQPLPSIHKVLVLSPVLKKKVANDQSTPSC